MQERKLIREIEKKKMNFFSQRDATASYRREQEWQEKLSRGALEEMEYSFDPESIYDEAVLTYKGDKKQVEYNLVASITLGCRAIIAGGVDPYEAYRISDIYLQQLSESADIEEMMWVGEQAMWEYNDLAKDASSKKQILFCQDVENAKTYICRHLRERLTMREVCRAIGVSEGNLSKKFRESGTTFRKYVLDERLKRGANLLAQTQQPVSVISDYLCFSSPSYFGSCFLKKYGLTPLEYRKRNKFCCN